MSPAQFDRQSKTSLPVTWKHCHHQTKTLKRSTHYLPMCYNKKTSNKNVGKNKIQVIYEPEIRNMTHLAYNQAQGPRRTKLGNYSEVTFILKVASYIRSFQEKGSFRNKGIWNTFEMF